MCLCLSASPFFHVYLSVCSEIMDVSGAHYDDVCLSIYLSLLYVCLSICLSVCKGKGKGIAHRRKHASNALSSLTRAACRTATVCSLQTQAGAAVG